jgi:hypothetical protein
MGYLSIRNLYKHQNVIGKYQEWWALEKIHGTSAHISVDLVKGKVKFFSGGENYENFCKLFNKEGILKGILDLENICCNGVILYGEAYGGRQQKMSGTYGDKLRFIVFDVMVGGKWLTVREAESITIKCGLEFVSYKKIKSTIEELNAAMSEQSIQAIRNGVGEGKVREGIVIRPMEEDVDDLGERVIYKHKTKEYSETKRVYALGEEVVKQQGNVEEIAKNWVTGMRLEHMLQKIKRDGVKETYTSVINYMLEDVKKESTDEVDISPALEKAVKKLVSKLYNRKLKSGVSEP